jgi:hypothetical protein
MPPAARRSAPAVLTQATEMALAVPQVVSHRVARMALAGPLPSARDRAEFHRMGAEKIEAMQESWQAMAAQAMQAQQTLAISLVRSWWAAPTMHSTGALHDMATQWQHSAWSVLHEGIAPLHRRAVANARRLNKPSGR